MGAANFCYDHRCVVVTNEDYEEGNIPELGEYVRDCNRSYPSTELADFNDGLNYFRIVMTSGYYEGACIDYTERSWESVFYDWNGDRGEWISESTSKRALLSYFHKNYGLSYYAMRKAMPKDTEDFNYKKLEYKYIEKCVDAIEELLIAREEAECNRRIDEIKKMYGYEEYGCCGHFSNGEALYTKIA